MAELIQKLHVEDRGLLMARMHNLADLLTIAAPNTNPLKAFLMFKHLLFLDWSPIVGHSSMNCWVLDQPGRELELRTSAIEAQPQPVLGNMHGGATPARVRFTAPTWVYTTKLHSLITLLKRIEIADIRPHLASAKVSLNQGQAERPVLSY